ncbi:predicted protein [Uncinocarpus reesii 1704]|uniref:Uncharacterized protein n=1 Tax=Uncinocarpus reesii (strain UAMH 1704) TaxID=336963 RepID=C4JQJ9_UNCRE|nr:uncharacterized protein UREG_03344 [Uncinocarpus reesii 1704]EEP78498.1 predicted protein [Uncinocarpus reesii 1704]
MRRVRAEIGTAGVNEDDDAAQYLLEELNSIRRSKSDRVSQKVTSRGDLWPQRASLSLYSFLEGSRSWASKLVGGHNRNPANHAGRRRPLSVRSVNELGDSDISLEIRKRRGPGNAGNQSPNRNGKGPKDKSDFANPHGNWNGNPPGLAGPADPPSFGPPPGIQPPPNAPEPPPPMSLTDQITASTIVPIGTQTTQPSVPTLYIQTKTVVSKMGETTGPGDIPSSPFDTTPSSTSSPGNSNNILHDPARVASLAVGVTIASLMLLTVIGWLILRCFRKRKYRNKYPVYQMTRPGELDGSWANEKDQTSKTGGGFEWDPESTFAPPFSKQQPFGHSRGRSSASLIFQRILKHTRIPSQRRSAQFNPLIHDKPLPKPPDTESQLSQTEHDSIVNDLPDMPEMPEKSRATISTRSSEAFHLDLPSPRHYFQQDRKGPGRGSISKFSWSTPTTKSTSIASVAPTYRLPSLTSNYAGTIFSDDSEPPHFRTTSSWVLHQQARISRRKWVDLDYPMSPTAVASTPRTRQNSDCLTPKERPPKRLSEETLN